MIMIMMIVMIYIGYERRHIMVAISITLLTICMFWFIMNYMFHIFDTLLSERTYDWVTFNSFKRVYQKYENKYNRYSRKNYGYYLDSKTIKFSDNYIIFYPLSYLKYRVWLLKEIYPISNRIKGLWNEGDEK